MNALARSPKQVGHLIQTRRKAQGLSQTELADRTGLRQELISRIGRMLDEGTLRPWAPQ